eukprot:scaffold4470_cov255-Prasinococcus_capsulatus_cf.AAC.7
MLPFWSHDQFENEFSSTVTPPTSAQAYLGWLDQLRHLRSSETAAAGCGRAARACALRRILARVGRSRLVRRRRSHTAADGGARSAAPASRGSCSSTPAAPHRFA